MTNPQGFDQKEQRKKNIQRCLQKFNLPLDFVYHEELLTLENLPSTPSKNFAFLILTYKRECTNEMLKKVSDQPAGMVKILRSKGFEFKRPSNSTKNFQFRNSRGEMCREILSYNPPKTQIQGITRDLIDKSIAACISAIEVYNKPDFKYREESFVILMINAWELLLKAKLVLSNNNNIRSIVAFESSGVPKLNRSGNTLTIDLFSAMKKLLANGVIDIRCCNNIEALIEIRDNAIHFINTDASIQKKVMELGTASLRNYVNAMKEWFNQDMGQYNFYLMPLSFFPQAKISDHAISEKSKLVSILKYINKLEEQYPSNNENSYNITLDYEIHLKKANRSNYDLLGDVSNEGLTVKVEEEQVYKDRYPLSFNDLIEKLKARYIDFKVNRHFFAIKKQLEDQKIYQERFCRERFLHPHEKRGLSKKFYSTEIFKEFDKYYTKRKI